MAGEHLKQFQFKKDDPERASSAAKQSSTRAMSLAQKVVAQIIDDPAYQANVKIRAIAGKLPPAVETMLWHYRFGKPKDEIDVNVKDAGANLAALTPDELIARHHAVTMDLLEARRVAEKLAADEATTGTDAAARDELGVAWEPDSKKPTVN